MLVAEIYDMMMGGGSVVEKWKKHAIITKARESTVFFPTGPTVNPFPGAGSVCMYVRTRGKPMGKKRVLEYAPRNSASGFVLLLSCPLSLILLKYSF